MSDMELAREKARSGDVDGAIELARTILVEQAETGEMIRALLARAHGDEFTYREFADRYRKMATDLGFEGHIAWAEAMT
jgi:hypothetical protein